MAQTPTNTQQIASMMTGIGQTQAAGVTGAAQAQQAAAGQTASAITGLGSGALFAAFSDERLKDNIKPTGYENGIPTFEWTWNKAAEKLGLKGKGFGTLSKYAKQVNPDSVQVENGYEKVNYNMLGVSHG